MFYIKESEFDLNSKQISKNLVRSGAVEKEVADINAMKPCEKVRGLKPCKDGNL